MEEMHDNKNKLKWSKKVATKSLIMVSQLDRSTQDGAAVVFGVGQMD